MRALRLTPFCLALAALAPAAAHAYESGCQVGGEPCVEGPPTARRPWRGGDAGEEYTDEHARLYDALFVASGLPDQAGQPFTWTQYVSGDDAAYASNVVCKLPEDDRGVLETLNALGEAVIGAVLDPRGAIEDHIAYLKGLLAGVQAVERCPQGTCRPSMALGGGVGRCTWEGPSHAPARFDTTGLALDRQRSAAELTQLPDFGWNLPDLIGGFEACPVGIADNADCHTFARHMGAYNSSHFPPQSQGFYRHYHRLALDRAAACAEALAAVPAEPRFDRFRTACFGEAMAYEGVAQHYLHDAWSVGHTWQRWGAPEPGDWATYAEAHLVALVSGLLHGAKSVVGLDDALNAPDDNVRIRLVDEDGQHAAVGDLYLERLLEDPAYAAQRQRLFACGAASLRAVYRAAGEPYGALGDGPEGADAVDPEGEGCFGQRATNAAMWAAAGLSQRVGPVRLDLRIEDLAVYRLLITASTLKRGPAGNQGPLAQAALEARFHRDMARIAMVMAATAVVDPGGTGLANGGLPPLLGARPNGAYAVADGLPAGYVDRLPEGDPRAADRPQGPDAVRRHGWSAAYADAWCQAFDGSDDRYALPTLQARVETTRAARAEEPGDLARADAADAACRVCLDFAERHVRVGEGPEAYDAAAEPLCHYLAPGVAEAVYVPADDCGGALPEPLRQTPAERYCGCVDRRRAAGTFAAFCIGEGCSTGDPHLTTLDGLAYDFQAAGEFLLVADDDGVQVQVRQTPLGEARCGAVAINTAVSLTVAGHRVSYFADAPEQVWIDGEAVPLDAAARTYGDCSRLAVGAGGLHVVWASGERLRVALSAGMLHVGFTPAAERAGIYRGLLGDFDGDPANDLRLADGSALAVDPLAGELLYGPFRAAWRAVDHGRLFEDRPGEGPGAFDRDDFPGELANLQGFDDEARALARAVCVDAGVRDEDRRLDECTLDVVCTGDPAAARPFVDQGAPALAPPVEGAPPGPDPSVEGCVAEGRHRVNAQRPQGWHDCPADCFEAEPSIWGTDVYTDDSKICAAAIHAGRLPADQAGRVYLEHRPGQDAYEGSVRNGVTSRAYGHWGDSFGFVDGP